MNSLTDTLIDSAFGAEPGRWPLPTARTQEQYWLRAVAAGGQGRYASASTELDRIDVHSPFRSLALSTRASFLRQLGRHDEAAGWDGRAYAAAGAASEPRADALLGLAADALGVGRYALSARLLARADDALPGVSSPRLPVRLAWVSAELSMATADGAAALGHAERAVALAAKCKSVRHAVKSDVVLAAAQCCAGALDASRHTADLALDAAERFGLVPLTWALACLLGDIGSSSRAPDAVAKVRAEAAALIRHRGGAWAHR